MYERGRIRVQLDPVVKKETGYIALWTLILSVLMEAVFLILRKWGLPVLFGNLLGGGVAIANFLLMGMTLTRALTMEQKKARLTAILSQIGRYLLLALAMVLGFKLPFLNPWTTIIPLLFPRFAIMLRARGGQAGPDTSSQAEADIGGQTNTGGQPEIKAGDANE